MTNYSVTNVDEYIAHAPEISRTHLAEIRAIVRDALPEAQEVISYGKPYYKHPKHLVGFDAYKNHINFEIYTGQLLDADRQALEELGYKTGSKSIQLRYDQPLPVVIIKKIAKQQDSIYQPTE